MSDAIGASLEKAGWVLAAAYGYQGSYEQWRAQAEARRAVAKREAAQRRSAAFKAARRRRGATVTPTRGARPAWQRSGKVPTQFSPATLSRNERIVRLAP